MSEVVEYSDFAEIFVPIATKSEANMRQHWAVKARRVKLQRETTRLFIQQALRNAGIKPCGIKNAAVFLERHSPRKLDDDNLRGALKGVRDGVADALGIDDGSHIVDWRYRQAVAKGKGVLVTIFTRFPSKVDGDSPQTP